MVDAAHYMQAHAGPGGSRAILILTDNLSMSYQLTDGQVIRELNKADTVFNAIVTGHAIEPNPPTPRMFPNPDLTPANVMHLADDTGGEWVKAEHADQSFNEMIERIRSRYMLAYHEPAIKSWRFPARGRSADGTAQKKYPLAELRSRTGYYAE